jgi:type VI protein secretion system component Hcp
MSRSLLTALGLTATLALAGGASPAPAKKPKPKPNVSNISFTHHIDKPSPVLLRLASGNAKYRERYQLRLGEASGL